MLSNAEFERAATRLPPLHQADSAFAREFREQTYMARIPAGHDVFVVGDRVNAIALLLSGVVRVYQVGETGREITLYRFGTGESCILTATAILNEQPFPAIATVEQEAEAIMIDAARFRTWVRQHPRWLEFVLGLLSQRLTAVMEIVDEVAFRRMDARLAEMLLVRSASANPISITHQDIADELGSSREVISRLLEHFTRQKLIQVGRGTLHVLDAEALRTYAAR